MDQAENTLKRDLTDQQKRARKRQRELYLRKRNYLRLHVARDRRRTQRTADAPLVDAWKNTGVA